MQGTSSSKVRKCFDQSVFALRYEYSANIKEAFYAHGKADFIAKLQIALKECSETEYWIELVLESGYYHDKTLLDKCTDLKRILISSLNTAKATQDKN